MICAEFPDALQGIDRENALFAAAEPAVFLWRSEARSIVVPRSRAGRPGFAALGDAAGRAGWPLLLRTSGGGAVPQGPGTLNLTMVARMSTCRCIEDGFRLICGAISEALMRFDVATDTGPVNASFCDGDWNVTAGGRKLAGTAQRWRPAGGGASVALIHAAIVLDHPPASVWPVLADVEAHAGGNTAPRRDVHVALRDLLPETMHVNAFNGALLRAAEDRLRTIIGPRTRRTVAA